MRVKNHLGKEKKKKNYLSILLECTSDCEDLAGFEVLRLKTLGMPERPLLRPHLVQQGWRVLRPTTRAEMYTGRDSPSQGNYGGLWDSLGGQ